MSKADPNDGKNDEIPDPATKAAEEALRIAKELEDKMNKKDDPKPDPKIPPTAEEIAKATGMSEAGVNFVINAVTAGSAESNARTAKAEVKERFKDFGRLEKAIDAELAKYPLEKRGSADLVEKVYWMELGKDSKNIKNNGGNKIRSSGGSDVNLDNGDGGGGGSTDLSTEERFVARKMGISEADYAKSKSTKLIHELKA